MSSSPLRTRPTVMVHVTPVLWVHAACQPASLSLVTQLLSNATLRFFA